jgi:hypothetical protein
MNALKRLSLGNDDLVFDQPVSIDQGKFMPFTARAIKHS